MGWEMGRQTWVWRGEPSILEHAASGNLVPSPWNRAVSALPATSFESGNR